MTGYLHLLSAATYLGDNTMLAVEDYADHPLFAGMHVLRVPPAEVYAVNTLAIGDRVIVPAGYPQVAALLHATRLRRCCPSPSRSSPRRTAG